MKQQNEQRNASNVSNARNQQQSNGQNKKNNGAENKKNNDESQNEKLSNADLHLNNNPQAY